MYHKVQICAPIISLCAVVAIFITGYSISGCRSNTNSTAKFTTPETTTPAATLSWDSPTTFTDGTALLELKEFRVYFSTSHNPYSFGSCYPVFASSTSVKLIDLISQGAGTYFFVVTAVDATNRESDPSNEVSMYLP
jgi:hypothetical protein